MPSRGIRATRSTTSVEPSAVGAALALRDSGRLPVAVCGDGDFLMNGQEFATAAQYGAAVIALVVNNGMYGTIRMHQEREYPERVSGTELKNPDFAAYERAFGGHGEVVEETAQFAPARRSEVARRRNGPPDAIHLLYVGRLTPEKELPLLFDAYRQAQARANGTRLHLVLAGGGAYAGRVRGAAPPGGPFAGHLGGEAVREGFAAAGVVVVPPRVEARGREPTKIVAPPASVAACASVSWAGGSPSAARACPAASSSACASPARWLWTRKSCCSMSRAPHSTRFRPRKSRNCSSCSRKAVRS